MNETTNTGGSSGPSAVQQSQPQHAGGSEYYNRINAMTRLIEQASVTEIVDAINKVKLTFEVAQIKKEL